MNQCDNCGEKITGRAIEYEDELTFHPRDAYQYDAPVLRRFCSEACKAEYLEPDYTPSELDLITQKKLS